MIYIMHNNRNYAKYDALVSLGIAVKRRLAL